MPSSSEDDIQGPRHLRRAQRRSLAVVFVAFILVATSIWFFVARDARGRTARLTADAWYYHAYLPSLVLDKDLDFSNEYKLTHNWYRFGKTPIGRPANVFGIGPAINEMPFFLVGHALAKATGKEANGFSRLEVESSLYASLVFSLGALFFVWRLLVRRFGGCYGPATIALLAAAAGPVVYYAIRQPGYAHPFATFWIAWLVDHWDSSFQGECAPRSRRFWIGMGLLIGAASLARPQLVLWSVLGLYAAISDFKRARALKLERSEVASLVGRWVLGAVLALLLVVPQLLAWKALYGSYLASPQGEGFMRWDASLWWHCLMSSRNGLLPWAPIYALGLVGVFVGLRRHARLCSALLLGLFLQAYVNGAAWDWWAGGSFGGRRFDSCFVVFALGLGVLILRPSPPKKKLLSTLMRASLVGLCILLAVANLHFASTQSAPTVRIHGGQAASGILQRSSGLLGKISAWASHLANLPARSLFAWQYQVPLSAYDQVVGVHQLGELFPGLNSFKGKKSQQLKLHASHPGVVGFDMAAPATLRAPTGKAHLLLGLNRLGAVQLIFKVSNMAGQSPTVQLNGQRLELTSLPNDSYQVTLHDYQRGSNRIDLQGAKGFLLHRMQLKSEFNAAAR